MIFVLNEAAAESGNSWTWLLMSSNLFRLLRLMRPDKAIKYGEAVLVLKCFQIFSGCSGCQSHIMLSNVLRLLELLRPYNAVKCVQEVEAQLLRPSC
jgi:hypothetical protein